MSKLSDLAVRPDFDFGSIRVSPSRRLVEGPAGRLNLEPLIMQVFLLLLDARGTVVTRDQLFDACWGGVVVGDDSLNRAVARVRRIAIEVAPGSFEVETIPRTGYRLVGRDLLEQAEDTQASPAPRIARRTLIAGAVALAGAGSVGWWSVRRYEANRRFDDLMARGEQALRYGDPATNEAAFFRQAVALRPDDAGALGRLAYAQANAVDRRRRTDPKAATEDAEIAARAALRIDPSEPYARLALIVLQRSTLDLATTEDRLREIHATAPGNIVVMRHLWGLWQTAGRSRDALALIERAVAIEPLAAANHYPRAQLLWILGRTAEADRVIDQAMISWPSHQFVRFARFNILAFTGRPQLALAMLETADTAPQGFTEEAIALWRVSLAALAERTPARIAATREASFEATRKTPGLTNHAVLALSALGEVDAAFEIANAFLLFHGSTALRARDSSAAPPAKSTAWRFTPWLFTPPVAAMRADPRFKTLCDGIGLTEYWQARKIKPDYLLS